MNRLYISFINLQPFYLLREALSALFSKMPNSEQKVEECYATGFHSSTVAGYIKNNYTLHISAFPHFHISTFSYFHIFIFSHSLQP
jgi:hypothetical protein